jgi:apolipoprotein N-acyltransferase
VSPEGQIGSIYDKKHLVPFGEYIPFQKYIPLQPVVEFSGFRAGTTPVSFPLPGGLSYAPLICYEAVFTGVVRPGTAGPDFIVNVTNDAWYGDSAGPRQHYTSVMFRAVETGIPVVRTANTGISGLIDPVGRSVIQIDLFEKNAKSSPLMKKIAVLSKPVYFENATFLLLIMLLIAPAYILRNTVRN